MSVKKILEALYNSNKPLLATEISRVIDEDRDKTNKALHKLRTIRYVVKRDDKTKKYTLTNKGIDEVEDKHVDVAKSPDKVEVKQPKKEEEMPETKEEIDTSGFSSVELAELHSELVNIEAKICSEVEDQDVKEIVLNSLIESTGGKVAEILESIRDNDVLR